MMPMNPRDALRRIKERLPTLDTLRSDATKRTVARHVLPVLAFFLVSIIVHRKALDGDGVFVNGDLARPVTVENYLGYFDPMWNADQGISTLSRLPQLLLLYPFLGAASLLGMDTTQFLKAEFVAIWALAGISMFYVTRFLLEERRRDGDFDANIPALLAGMAYAWNGFTIAHVFHPFIRIALALAPLFFLALYLGFSRGRARFLVLGGLLWCLMCGAVHWMVYGGVLALLVLLYFVLRDARGARGRPLVATARPMAKHLGLLGVLVLSFLAFSAYWILPGYFMGNTSLYGNIITHETLADSYESVDLGSMLSLDASQLVTSRMFETDDPLLGSSASLLTFSALGVLLLGIALATFLFPRRRGLKVLLLAIFLVALAQSLMMEYYPDAGAWFVLEAPLHGMYGWAFRTPKFVQLIFLAVSLLLALSVHDILSWVKRRRPSINVQQGSAVAVMAVVLISITVPNWPLATGDFNGNLRAVDLPDEFDQVFEWLDEQEGDFKVLWVPDYRSTDVDWNEGLRTKKDIISLSSPRPTYFFDDRHTQPNGYGIYFLESLFSADHVSSMLYGDETDDLGRMLYPLGVRYVIFHDDNATKSDKEGLLLDNLYRQSDMVPVERFGMIHVFENTFRPAGQEGRVFAVSNEVLLYGGMSALDTLCSTPGYDPSTSVVVFGDQTHLDTGGLRDHIDTIVFNGDPDLDQVALSLVDPAYVTRPFDAIDHSGKPGKMWSKRYIEDMTLPGIVRRSGSAVREWAYDADFVYTWGEGTARQGQDLVGERSILHLGFEDGTIPFEVDTSDFELTFSNRSMDGLSSIKGTMAPGPPNGETMMANTRPLPIGTGHGPYRVSMEFAATNANKIQLRLVFYDGDGQKVKKVFLTTRTGVFDFTSLSETVDLPSDMRTMELSVMAEAHPTMPTEWWLDNVSVSRVERDVEPNRLEVPFTTSARGDHEVFVRLLRSEGGGWVDLALDGGGLTDIATRGSPPGFFWRGLGTVSLSPGQHVVAIDNSEGFNAVNLVAVVPSARMEAYRRAAGDLVARTAILQTVEGESIAATSGSEASEAFGNSVSNGATLAVGPGGSARTTIRTLKDGEVSVFVKAHGDLADANVRISIDDRSWRFDGEGIADDGWISIHGIDIGAGAHLLTVENLRDRGGKEGLHIDVVHVLTMDGASGLEDAFRGDGPVSVDVVGRPDGNRVEFRVRGEGPVTICLRDTYDEMWVLRGPDGGPVKSVPVDGMLNGFMVDAAGSSRLVIEYRPQAQYGLGMTISLLSILLFFMASTVAVYRHRTDLLRLARREARRARRALAPPEPPGPPDDGRALPTRLSIVIPAYNEEDRIGDCLRMCIDHFEPEYGDGFELVVVTDGCIDRTCEVVSDVGSDRIRHFDFGERLGKGAAISRGYGLARGELICYTDADGSTPPDQLSQLVRTLEGTDCDGVCASRYAAGGSTGRSLPIHRKVASRGYNLMVRALFGLPFKDTQCGAKVFRRRVAGDIFEDLQVTDWAFDVNLLYNAHVRGYDVREVGIQWEDSEGSKLRMGRVVPKMFLSTIRLRLIRSPVRRLVDNRWSRRAGATIKRMMGDGR